MRLENTVTSCTRCHVYSSLSLKTPGFESPLAADTFTALRRYIVHLLYTHTLGRSASFTAVPEAALSSRSRLAAAALEMWSVRVLFRVSASFP